MIEASGLSASSDTRATAWRGNERGRVSQTVDERRAALMALSPTIHVSFRQLVFTFASGQQAYWYAGWNEEGTGKHCSLYLGKEPPDYHPCSHGVRNELTGLVCSQDPLLDEHRAPAWLFCSTLLLPPEHLGIRGHAGRPQPLYRTGASICTAPAAFWLGPFPSS